MLQQLYIYTFSLQFYSWIKEKFLHISSRLTNENFPQK